MSYVLSRRTCGRWPGRTWRRWSPAPRESSSIAQLDGSDIVYVARVAVPKIIALAVTIGTRFPAMQTSLGKVLLAACLPSEAERGAGRAQPVRASPPAGSPARPSAPPSCAPSAPAAGR